MGKNKKDERLITQEEWMWTNEKRLPSVVTNEKIHDLLELEAKVGVGFSHLMKFLLEAGPLIRPLCEEIIRLRNQHGYLEK